MVRVKSIFSSDSPAGTGIIICTVPFECGIETGLPFSMTRQAG
jgi:hypothetical protein